MKRDYRVVIGHMIIIVISAVIMGFGVQYWYAPLILGGAAGIFCAAASLIMYCDKYK